MMMVGRDIDYWRQPETETGGSLYDEMSNIYEVVKLVKLGSWWRGRSGLSGGWCQDCWYMGI